MLGTGMLEGSWDRCWASIGAAGDGRAAMARVLASWNQAHRRYHTVQHLIECLALLERYRGTADEPAEVELALWFHDAVHDLRASDNEARSADWAARELRQARVAEPRIARVRDHILATRHAASPTPGDQALLVDIDLAILGAERPRFDEYERQVRDEYAWVPAPVYRRKRREVFSGFMERSPLYRTAGLHAAREARAKANLARSLAMPAA